MFSSDFRKIAVHLFVIFVKFARGYIVMCVMDIVKLQGTDRKLYEFVCPLVMNPAILRQNNNYPFKTGPRYVWYIAAGGEQVIGFIPVRKTTTGNYVIDNYYVKGDDGVVLNKLLVEVIKEEARRADLWAIVHKRHVKQFLQNGFRIHIEWKNYNKMRYYLEERAICTD